MDEMAREAAYDEQMKAASLAEKGFCIECRDEDIEIEETARCEKCHEKLMEEVAEK